ncbi:hypothetical protein [Ferviditalea candida]|uniref:Uncharacterized protein n=1 Tax=Ferviditalea candida TaxID=3108399 RepID=A0ABU5ZG90_9BACL|nr:hypothetical protein [Paenibacillaceae bacterium T2]
MQILAQYPIEVSTAQAFVGRPLGVLLPDGDFMVGVMDRIYDGNIVMRPLDGGVAVSQSMKKAIKGNPHVQALLKKSEQWKREGRLQANTKAWAGAGAAAGAGFYPFGWGFGNWGWGFGWWWIFPLLFALAFFAWPFFW